MSLCDTCSGTEEETFTCDNCKLQVCVDCADVFLSLCYDCAEKLVEEGPNETR